MKRLELQSDREWLAYYESHRFSFKEWDNFLDFFYLDRKQQVVVPSRAIGEDGTRMKERQVKLADLPKFKSGLGGLILAVQTENKLVTFDTAGPIFKIGYDKAKSAKGEKAAA